MVNSFHWCDQGVIENRYIAPWCDVYMGVCGYNNNYVVLPLNWTINH